MAPRPPATAQPDRVSGAVSSVSRRPLSSSEAQRLTNVAAEKPTTMRPISTKTSCRNQPALARSTPGKIVRMMSAKAGTR